MSNNSLRLAFSTRSRYNPPTPASRHPGGLHEATFNLDENALPIGAAMLAETALRFVRGELK
ncbi:MAG: amidohydrolase [Anaerolineales bacterium]|nr:amidohydrolase [Anaerolineales bacterium]